MHIKNTAKQIIKNAFNSPTIMSWMSLITKSLTFFLVIPLMVTHFSAADVALWYLFVTALGLQLIADLGFSSTLIRMFSYAQGGLSVENISSLKAGNEKRENLGLNTNAVEAIWQVMNFIYKRLAAIFFVFILVSSFFLHNPIAKTTSPERSLAAWIVIIVTSFVQLRYSTFSNFLQGMNKIAIVKRIEAILNLLAILSNSLILYFGGDLLLLVVSTQFWALANILRDYFLCRTIDNGVFNTIDIKARKNKVIYDVVWPSAWKSGLGMLMSVGLLQVTNMIFAKDGKSAEVATYLLGYNLIRQISGFSQAPFYSRIPLLAKLRAQNDIETLTAVAKKGMSITYWCFTGLIIFIGLFGKYGLPYIKSNVNFPTQFLWAIMGFGILIERFGAMHIQLLSTTNKIIWHIANSVTGVVFLAIFFIGKQYLGLYIFPVALIGSNLAFYAWYCAVHSYRSINVTFFEFEKKVFLIPLAIYLVYIMAALYIK